MERGEDFNGNKMIAMDCVVCENKERFKKIIKEGFGDNIKFKLTKDLQVGELYCTIIGELTYNKEKYFNKTSFECSHCGAKVVAFGNNKYKIDEANIKWQFFNTQNDYSKYLFCSSECKSKFIESEKRKIDPDAESDFYIRKEDFINPRINGYIYKITKKGTKENYVGKTINIPIWRWGQHLLTTRFPKDKIEDYTFEVLEVVKSGLDLAEREKHWIIKGYLENPTLCLNIQMPKSVPLPKDFLNEEMKEDWRERGERK